MRNTWLVATQELRTTVKRRSFWLMTFLMPALLLAGQAYGAVKSTGLVLEGAGEGENEETMSVAETTVIGVVDDLGIITDVPVGLPAGRFQRFAGEAAARAALDADEIQQYVHIPADYVATGDVTVYDRDFQIRIGGEKMGVAFHAADEWMLEYLINYGLTGDEQLVGALREPVPAVETERHVVSPALETEEGVRALGRVVARVMPYMFYFVLLVGSGYLLRSVVAEKENRTVGVLLLSLDPRELMAGKILGLGAVTLLQLGVWLGGGMLLLDHGMALLSVSSFALPPGFAVWVMLFLGLGFLLFASVMAAAGAIAPNAREGAQVTWLLMLPLLPTLMFGDLFIDQPNNPLVLILSLFPFSAPSAMVTRVAVGDVPFWQIIVSLLGLAGTTVLMVMLAARFFRAGNLVSSVPFKLRRLVTEWRE